MTPLHREIRMASSLEMEAVAAEIAKVGEALPDKAEGRHRAMWVDYDPDTDRVSIRVEEEER